MDFSGGICHLPRSFVALVNVLPSLIQSASATPNPSVSGLLWAVVGLAVVAFVAVEAAVVWQALRHPPAQASRRRVIEIAWLATPAVILLALLVWSGVVLGSDVRSAPAKPDLTIAIDGRMFVWNIHYAGDRLSLNQLHLPVGKVARIDLTSDDVVHGFWIPQFRVKQQAKPGQTVTIYLQPMETGDFNIVCAELCGNSHYAMRGFVHVESQEDFDRWLATQEPGA